MTDIPTDTVDPRYDPAFQRNGSSAFAGDRPQSRDAIEVTGPDLAGSDFTVPDLGGLGLVEPPLVEPSLIEPDITDQVDTDSDPVGEVDELMSDDPPRRHLSWQVAILVVCTGLVLGGLVAVYWGIDLYYGVMSTAEPTDVGELRARQIAITVGPFVVGVGLAGLVGLMLVRAMLSGRSR